MFFIFVVDAVEDGTGHPVEGLFRGGRLDKLLQLYDGLQAVFVVPVLSVLLVFVQVAVIAAEDDSRYLQPPRIVEQKGGGVVDLDIGRVVYQSLDVGVGGGKLER